MMAVVTVGSRAWIGRCSAGGTREIIRSMFIDVAARAMGVTICVITTPAADVMICEITTPVETIDVGLRVTTTGIGLGLAVRVVGVTWARRVSRQVPTRHRGRSAGDAGNRVT
jgi:hypothetical protein